MIPDGWKEKSLEDVTKEKISYGIVQAGPHVEAGVPYLKSSDVGGQIVVETLQKTCPTIHSKYKRSSVHPGDIVFSLRGNIGECSIVPETLPEANLTQGTARISVAPPHVAEFIRYKITSTPVLNRIHSLSKGSTFKEISLAELRQLQVLIPEPHEQRRIAKILSTWDRAIETTEKLIANSQAQKKALMQQLLTGKKRLPGFDGEWQTKQLGSLAIVKMGSSPKSETYNEIGEGLPLLQGNADIKNGRSRPRIFTSEPTQRCSVGDILLSVRAPVGSIAISDHEACIGRGLAAITPKHQTAYHYILEYMKFQEPRWQSLSQGSTFEAISSKDVKTLSIPTPPSIEETEALGLLFASTSREIILLKNSLDQLCTEKNALMQQLLTGKRRVKIEEISA
jgi:type I restriction enzyme S subunit